jgi:hypothetical protein
MSGSVLFGGNIFVGKMALLLNILPKMKHKIVFNDMF